MTTRTQSRYSAPASTGPTTRAGHFGSVDEARAWTQKFVRWYNQSTNTAA